MRVDLDRFALASHFRIAHPLEKKEYRKLIHKWRKVTPTNQGRKATPKCRPEQRRNFWTKVPKALSPLLPPRKPRRRTKKRKENIRKGAVLPDVLRINNHVRFTRMSLREHNARCLNLSKQCRKEVTCDEHTSLLNLRQITMKLKKLVSQSPGRTTDWGRYKKVQSRSLGFLSSAVNNPEIKREVDRISELVNRFNKIKENLEEYKEEIFLKYPTPSNPIKHLPPGQPEPRRFWRFTHLSLIHI